MVRFACIIALVFAFPVVAWGQLNTPQLRTWTDSTGVYKLQATFASLDGEIVLLRKIDGKIVRVPLARLSKSDQQFARAAASKSAPVAAKSATGLTASAVASRKEPPGVIVFSEIERQQPVFVTLKIQGSLIADAVRYGRFRFEPIKDSAGKTLKLLKPLEGKFPEKLETEMVKLDHFFLEKPDLLTLHLILQNPTAGASHISLRGMFQLQVRPVITIDNVMSKLGKPLKAPGLDKVGQFTPSLPRPGESRVKGSLAVDFVGDRTKIDDIEILQGDGVKISTGGEGTGSRRKARIIRWAGEDLPRNAKLRIVLTGESKLISVPIQLDKITLTSNRTSKNTTPARPPRPTSSRPSTGRVPTTSNTNSAVAPRQDAIPFFRACQQGDLPTVRRLLAKYPSLIRRKDPRWRETAFSKACWNGRLEIVQFLIEQGADVNARAGDKVTPLHQAARRGKMQVVLLLLKHGADPSLKSNTGATAADLAAKNGFAAVEQKLRVTERNRQ